MAADGETFSFEWLCDWAQAEQERAWADGRPFELISPFNRKVLTNDRLIPDIAMRALMAQLGVEVDHGAEHSYELPKASLPQDASWPALGEVTSNIWATFEGTDIQVRGVVRTEIREENIQVRGGVRGEIRRESWVPEDIVIMQNVSA